MSLKKIISKIPFITFKRSAETNENVLNIGSPMSNKEYEKRLKTADKTVKTIKNDLTEGTENFFDFEKLNDFNVFVEIKENEHIFLYSNDISKIVSELTNDGYVIEKDPDHESEDIANILQIRWRKFPICYNGRNGYIIIPASNPIVEPEE